MNLECCHVARVSQPQLSFLVDELVIITCVYVKLFVLIFILKELCCVVRYWLTHVQQIPGVG